jgi:hypothetical protein
MTHSVTAPKGPTRPFAFTVSTALAWLGHDCAGGCPALATSTPASLWFVPQPSPRYLSRQQSLIVVDPGDDPERAAEVRALLREVNRCIGRSHIQVREQVTIDQQRTLVTRPDARPTSDAALYLRSRDQPSNETSSRSDQPEPTSALCDGGRTAEARAMA